MYRAQRNYENLNRAIYVGDGPFDFPRIEPETLIKADRVIGFNYAKTCKDPENTGVHFFIDDYQFQRLWANPDAYLELLRQFKFVFTPDFSMYTDFPKAVQIFNAYRNHWLGAYWQENDIRVIPTVLWSDESSFEWCFSGDPVGGVVAVSSVGTQMHKESREIFLRGYNEMLQRLAPKAIYFYGAVPKECEGNIIKIAAFQESLRKRADKSPSRREA